MVSLLRGFSISRDSGNIMPHDTKKALDIKEALDKPVRGASAREDLDLVEEGATHAPARLGGEAVGFERLLCASSSGRRSRSTPPWFARRATSTGLLRAH